jgi:predicted RNA binding protein YcfA (HicA-like mRNA interferase family)
VTSQKDINQVLKDAENQGFKIGEIDGSGHRRVLAPDGTRLTVATTPKNNRSVMNDVGKLVAKGFVPRGKPPKKKVKNEETVDAEVASVLRDPEDMAVPTFGELARVVPAKEKPKETAVVEVPSPNRSSRRSEIMPASEILKNLQLAGWLVWQHIVDEIHAHPDASRVVKMRGITGYQWKGSRHGMISRVWPGLSPVDYSKSPPAMSDERRELCKYLTQSKNMAVIEEGFKYQKTTWWISQVWNDVDPNKLVATTGNWWEDKVTREEAGETRPAEPVTVKFKCPLCPFTSATQAGLSGHKGRTQGEHAQGNYPCPVGDCVEVRTTPELFGNHVTKEHRELGLGVCRICDPPSVHESHDARRQHLNDVHSFTVGVTKSGQETLDEIVERDFDNAQLVGKPVPENQMSRYGNDTIEGRPVTVVDAGELNSFGEHDPVAALRNIITEITTLRAKSTFVEELEAEIHDLRDQLIDKERDATIKEAERAALDEQLSAKEEAYTKLADRYAKLKKKVQIFFDNDDDD